MDTMNFRHVVTNMAHVLKSCMQHGLSFAQAIAVVQATASDAPSFVVNENAYDVSCAMRSGMSLADSLAAIRQRVNPLHVVNAMRSGLGLDDAVRVVKGGSFCYDPRSFGEPLALAA